MQPRGFTLIEMILTMVVSSILVLAVAGFMKFSVDSVTSSYDRQQLQSQGQFTIEKMTREIRHAVPNSVYDPNATDSALNGKCLAFAPIVSPAFYAVKNNDVAFFLARKDDDYNTASTLPSSMRLVINPLNVASLTSSSSSFEVSGLTSVPLSTQSVFAAKTSSGSASNALSYIFTKVGVASDLTISSSNRGYVFSTQIVEYCLASGQLTRQRIHLNDNRAIDAATVVANNINTDASHLTIYTTHSSSSLATHQGSTATPISPTTLVQLSLLFQQGDEQSQYQQDVKVVNVP